ncbi:hypothetical protein mflW37_0860 [Mesoplasma florum W37]|uniref:Uncharacterized protein n=1 Tax=Mesoplasma florum TaxID=2151 RepID=A0AAD2JDQ6_MESFO|nr:hypothetical protein [Mesoplasma florum]AGY41153.1 hypothetical protein mflW37_0860 [Mesoplasma florum W37]AVN59384.1 hypothetical protein CG008_00430 [Mesoplasma florum]AVN65491.1 hypothetical protein MflW12_0860 [Mesoplasma florum]
MKKNIKIETRVLITIELISALCGTIGIILGMLSLLSLSSKTWGEADPEASFIFTVLTVCFDTLSTATAILAFKYGGTILKRKCEKGMKILPLEKFANRLDLYSFFFGLAGLTLSILSLLFLFDFMKSDTGSEVSTMLSIVCDSISATIVIWVVKIMLKISYLEHQMRKNKN